MSKIQQLIYTSVKSSLSDVEKGLINQAGFRVYSCSEGLEKEDIAEIVKYTSYRLPRGCSTGYSMKVFDPSVPELFPKTFRAFTLPNGRSVAMQSVYSGYDFEGNPGNFFAHAFIFDDESVNPAEYFGSPDFKTYLTEAEYDKPIVTYLPELDEVKKQEDLWEKVDAFVDKHTEEFMYVFAHAMAVLESMTKKHLNLVCSTQEESELYLLAIKRYLPPTIKEGTGVSTYNIFLPSEKQTAITFNATVKGMNNITEKSLASHPYCEQIDMESTDFSHSIIPPVFDIPKEKLFEYYGKYNITSVMQLKTWLKTFEPAGGGVTAKLDALKNICGDEMYKERVEELYNADAKEDISGIYFELISSMFANITLFPDKENEIIKDYLICGIENICMGEDCNLENVYKQIATPQEAAKTTIGYLSAIMDIISVNYDTLTDKKALLILRLLAVIKQMANIGSWKEMFSDNREYMSLFVEMTANSVIGTKGKLSLTAPVIWTKEEFAEAVAYILSSTSDERIIALCEKYISDNRSIDWDSFGVKITEREKSDEEKLDDLRSVKYLLSKVGYVPYSGGSYSDIKKEVITDMTDNKNPLLLSRLLWAYYEWASCGGRPQEAQKEAEKVRELLCIMRETEPGCYNFIIPKLALEILNTYSHFHELMINTDTMPPSFWEWFLIGYKNAEGNIDIRTVYQRVYTSNKSKMLRIPARSRLRKEFRNIE